MKLLLHMCCGPCSIYPSSVLHSKNINFEGIYFNPNIHPLRENVKRMENLNLVSKNQEFRVNYLLEYNQQSWCKFNNDIENRCNYCYNLRLNKIAEYAKENGFDSFTTTLLISPYQNHDLIIKISTNIAKKNNLIFYYEDFRLGFRKSQNDAREMNIYRQKYCGCLPSKFEASNMRKKTKNKNL